VANLTQLYDLNVQSRAFRKRRGVFVGQSFEQRVHQYVYPAA